ncbi:MAG: hypothetical protein Q7R33_01655 [Nitrosarchaeum sp.]|nr:hypothetical protein [Nitrosarchaeum sp.]
MNANQIGVDQSTFKAALSEKVQEVERRAKAANSQLSEYRREHGKLQVFFDELKDLIPTIAPQPLSITKHKSTKVSSPCCAVMCVNDLHYGAVQDASEVEGFGEFSPEIAKARMTSYTEKALNWVELHRTNYTINELVVLALGDLISGDIHDELRVTNAFPAPVQCVGAGELIAAQIAALAPHFEKVRVEFVVEDNHARLTKKPQAKEAGLNSFNYIVGYIAKTLLKEHKNVVFNMYPQYEATVTVLNSRYLLCHGHGVMGWAGFPWYGVERKISKEALKRMNGPDMNKFNRVIGGHWHTPLATPWYWFSGSVSGTDAYDHKQGRHSVPSQAAWIVHPRYNEFDRTDFEL